MARETVCVLTAGGAVFDFCGCLSYCGGSSPDPDCSGACGMAVSEKIKILEK